uniref:AAA domain-containing protein n=1 Tax=Parastrongyloides trichosuri TaxID=131310 RepID=A0A0N4Z6M7_PARTI
MSWLFGVKPQGVPNVPPPDFNPENGQGAPNSSNTQQQPAGSSISQYSFDSSALERAARAAKELEKSGNAREALELSRLQEITRQKEIDKDKTLLEAQITNAKIEQTRVMEEERRKTLNEETKHARSRADYQDQLARKRTQEEIALKQKFEEENRRKQEESIAKQEAIRKKTIEHELQLRHKFDLEKIDTEVKARAKAARENRDVNLEQLRANEEERRKTVVEQIKTSGALIGSGLQEFFSDKKKMTAFVGTATALAVGWYAAKRGSSIAAKYVETHLGKPNLVRETSRITPLEIARHPINTVKQVFRKTSDPLEGVVIAPKLESRLRDIAITTKNVKRNNGLFRNVLFYGPPGTGKTLFAKSLAKHSGLDYAILTGGDVAPMGADGVSAIHKVFDWAHTSRKGLVLFVDEADAFLRKRSTEKISEHMRAMLNAFLYRTGEQSSKFMLILASNQPEQFDWAINDRLDELVYFGLPEQPERERILIQYFKQYIVDLATSKSRTSRLKIDDFDWIELIKDISIKTEGMSGRELSKLVFGWQALAYASEDGVLTKKIIEDSLENAINQHKRKMDWLLKEINTLNPKAHGNLALDNKL